MTTVMDIAPVLAAVEARNATITGMVTTDRHVAKIEPTYLPLALTEVYRSRFGYASWGSQVQYAHIRVLFYIATVASSGIDENYNLAVTFFDRARAVWGDTTSITGQNDTLGGTVEAWGRIGEDYITSEGVHRLPDLAGVPYWGFFFIIPIKEKLT